MPQMAPLSWTILLIFFSSLLILSIILNFYSFIYSPKYKMKFSKTLSINWKW